MARTRKSDSTEPSPVRLKPILGVKPDSYLPIVLGLGVLLILFVLLVYPGIRNYGSEVTFRSTPSGAEVVLDGVRLGATPLTRFIAAGEHELTIRYPGFETEERRLRVPGRVFATLITPRRHHLASELTPLAPEQLARDRAGAFARWALGGAESAAFQAPPVIAETGRALGSFPEVPEAVRAGRRLLSTARHHIASPTQLKDLARGTLLLNGHGGVSPLSVSRSVLDLIQPANNSQGSAALQAILSRSLPSGLNERFQEGAWYDADRLLEDEPSPGVTDLPNTLSLEGMTFRATPSGVLMMEREVTRADYAGFLSDTPLWSAENRQALMEAGSVTEEYLADWEIPRNSAEPIRYVSWHAASAFAEWMTQRLQQEYPTYRGELVVRLPREEEWRRAAATESPPGSGGGAPGRVLFESDGESPYPVTPDRRNRLGVYDLYGNLWEWSADWYTPSPEARYLTVSEEQPIGGAERVVQGGSFANSARDLSGDLRGSQPPSWCSPYLGFRLVLAVQEEEL